MGFLDAYYNSEVIIYIFDMIFKMLEQRWNLWVVKISFSVCSKFCHNIKWGIGKMSCKQRGSRVQG